MNGRSRWWQLADDEEGLGLIEVMVSIFVLGVALLALASVATTSLGSMRITRDREQAINAASAAIEDARSRDFGGMVMAPGAVAVGAVPPEALPGPSTDSCFNGEPVATDAVSDPVPFHHVAGEQGRIDVYTIVTYAEVGCGETSDLKRVTAMATWRDGSMVRVVTQETLVVAAGRGLPVPRFELRPQVASLDVSRAYLTDAAISPKTRCIEHQLRNLGAEDSYQWELVDVSSGSISALGTGTGYRNNDWNVTAYLELDADPATSGTLPPASALLGGAPPRPVSDERVEPGATARFSVCYEPRSGSYNPSENKWPDDLTATIEVYSRFDDRQVRTLVHDVTVRDQAAPGTPLHLFDVEDSVAHQRPRSGSTYLPSSMGPVADPDASPELVSHLGQIDYADPSLSNWSTEAGSTPGVRLTRPTDGNRGIAAHTAGWHHQFLSATTLMPQSTLILWHAPTGALTGGLTEDQTVNLEVRIDGLRQNENTGYWSPGVAVPFQYVHEAGEGWRELHIPIDLGGEVSFQSSRYLRLRVTCAPSNTDECNLAYDNVAYPSALYVQVK